MIIYDDDDDVISKRQVREVLPCTTLQILFAKKLKNGMNCFSTGFRAGDKENRHGALDY